MSDQPLATWTRNDEAQPKRDVWRAIGRGLLCRCPHCGTGKIFRSYLKVNDHCPVCDEALHHQRADDAPPYFVILITGHVIVSLALSIEFTYAPPYWLHLVIWLPLTLLMTLGLLQPVKGALVGLQWAMRMHGFGGRDINDPPLAPSQAP